jgi:hypothetical protein
MLVQGSQQQKKLVLTKAKNISKKDKNMDIESKDIESKTHKGL